MSEEEINYSELRSEVEPWLSVIFQSEHLSALINSILTSSVSFIAGVKAQKMRCHSLEHELEDKIKENGNKSAIDMNRGEANIEDDIRVALELINGLKIIDDLRSARLLVE